MSFPSRYNPLKNGWRLLLVWHTPENREILFFVATPKNTGRPPFICSWPSKKKREGESQTKKKREALFFLLFVPTLLILFYLFSHRGPHPNNGWKEPTKARQQHVLRRKLPPIFSFTSTSRELPQQKKKKKKKRKPP
ncbi:hypothetical protein KP509_22G010800 [Ceratopteris richardii]|uniref:Uncharacterized protein n=1 Tax=Ceratopteris richardii TaxID=49495 RepID=A0A8T2S2Q7_CERRI|nr:hypothetical protein KP509_22G010800 [Ceratopteris richardii]